MRRLFALCTVLATAAIATFACIRDELVECADELCPVSFVCTAGGCAHPDAVAACAGLDDGAMCILTGPGTCSGGACYPAACGNAIVDLGEACDDGNTEGLDGCSRDCRSTELCGNTLTDLVLGEQCDDGDGAQSGDGCSSRCLLEVEVWRELGFPAPSTRTQTTWDLDANGRLIAFGGSLGSAGNGEIVDQLFAWDGLTWRLVDSVHKPPPLKDAAAAYDSHRKRLVLFGGVGSNQVADGRTWEWDGTDWTERTPTTSPAPRAGGRMAYDVKRRRMVLFGGATHPETWEWDGTAGTWTMVATTGPSPRIRHGLAYRADTEQILLVGGRDGVGSAGLPETWTWNGSAWTQTAITTPTADVCTLAGSGSSTYLVTPTDSYLLSSGWDSLAESPPTGLDRIVFDPRTSRLTGLAFGFAYELGSNGWSPIASVQTPPYGQVDRSSYDARRGRSVVAGSVGVGTWEWDGTGWERREAPPATPLSGAAMTYDSVRGETIRFGGVRNGAQIDETASWNGTTWTVLSPTQRPSARSVPRFAFDHARGVGVLYGGIQLGTTLTDTWEWNGTTWTERATTGPSPRLGAAIAYDPVSQRVVMFGGGTSGTSPPSNETWLWDGTTWSQAVTPVAPPGRRGAVLHYEPRRRRLFLTGGVVDSTQSVVGTDAWEWDGATSSWSPRAIAAPFGEFARTSFIDVNGDVLAISGNSTGVLARKTSISETPRETCEITADNDGDGRSGCNDRDCAGRCDPSCWYATSCDPAAARCGDANCNPWLETNASCPADCAP